MDIKTYKLTVQPAGYGNQTGLYSSTVHPTSATATTIAASSTQTTPPGGTCSWNVCFIKFHILTVYLELPNMEQ